MKALGWTIFAYCLVGVSISGVQMGGRHLDCPRDPILRPDPILALMWLAPIVAGAVTSSVRPHVPFVKVECQEP